MMERTRFVHSLVGGSVICLPSRGKFEKIRIELTLSLD